MSVADDVASRLLLYDVMALAPKKRVALAEEFVQEVGGVDELETLWKSVSGRGVRDPAAVMATRLQNLPACKEIIRIHGGSKGPDMDLLASKDQDQAQSRAGGFETVADWELDRKHALMWERWRYDHRNLPIEDRTAAVAKHFGMSTEDAYDILDRECRKESKDRTDTQGELALMEYQALIEKQRKAALKAIRSTKSRQDAYPFRP
jgi:hypothetical protein